MMREIMISRRGRRTDGTSLSSAEAMAVSRYGPCSPMAARPTSSPTRGAIRNRRGGLSKNRQLSSGFRVFTKSIGTSKQDLHLYGGLCDFEQEELCSAVRDGRVTDCGRLQEE